VLYAPHTNIIKFLPPRDISLRQQQAGAAGWVSWLSHSLGQGQRVGEVGERDECLARLRRSERVLGGRVRDLEGKMDTHRTEAAAYLVRIAHIHPLLSMLCHG
jgi:hypothetical protein